VVDVEVATSLAGKQQRRAIALPDPVERIEGAGLQRHRSRARLRLRDLQLPSREGAAHVGDAFFSVDVAFLQCDPFRRT
jgi:hypothetical protein